MKIGRGRGGVLYCVIFVYGCPSVLPQPAVSKLDPVIALIPVRATHEH